MPGREARTTGKADLMKLSRIDRSLGIAGAEKKKENTQVKPGKMKLDEQSQKNQDETSWRGDVSSPTTETPNASLELWYITNTCTSNLDHVYSPQSPRTSMDEA